VRRWQDALVLELRPICENCAKPLPPDSIEAMICSFECTFCATCVDEVLEGVCPNCAANFGPRPIRPARNWRGDNWLGKYPASEVEKHRPVDLAEQRVLLDEVGHIVPERR
jgi:hypothetical protein